jgi:SPP1 family phage portal protein
MDIKELFEGKTPAQQVSALKIRRNCSPAPVVDELKSQYNPIGHRINDRAYRPDKPIKEEREIPLGMGLQKRKEKVIVRFEEVNRIALPLQRLIVDRAVSFLFANPVKITTKTTKPDELQILDAVRVINNDNKIDAFNRRLAREVFTYKEAAEYWYPVNKKEATDDYGFNTIKRLRVALFSPANGDELYPLFDEHGDMIAFSRQYVYTDLEKKDHVYFDTFTDDMILHYERTGTTGWQIVTAVPNELGKIPVVYTSQPQTEWSDVQPIIERLEKLLSNFAETNDYHASPKLFVTGKILGWSKKGEAGAIIEGDKDCKVSYLSWDHAPESVKLEIETLLRLVYSMTQTPDISFEAVKGIGDVSGIALKLLFMDAHLKGYNKEEVFGSTIQRRTSIQKSYLGTFDKTKADAARRLRTSPVFDLFMLENDKEKVETMVTANGGKPIVSQKESVRKGGVADDPDKDWEQIQTEAAEESTVSVFGK